jgi:hypothetical protein
VKVNARVEGLEEALDEMDEAIVEVVKEARQGLWEAGLKLIRLAQIELKKSVITGNLRASAYVRNMLTRDRPNSDGLIQSMNEPIPSDRLPEIAVELGFTAGYGLFVHENMEGRSPKFLEGPILRNQKEVLDILKAHTGGE